MRYFKHKHGVRWFKLSVLLLGFVSAIPVADAALIVIGNHDVPVKHLSKDELANLYLGKPVNINMSLVPIDQSSSSVLYRQFYQNVLGWSGNQVASYWSSRTFGGDSNQPEQVTSDRDMIQAVEHTAGAIGYINSSSLHAAYGHVRVLYSIGHYTAPIIHHHAIHAHHVHHHAHKKQLLHTSQHKAPSTSKPKAAPSHTKTPATQATPANADQVIAQLNKVAKKITVPPVVKQQAPQQTAQQAQQELQTLAQKAEQQPKLVIKALPQSEWKVIPNATQPPVAATNNSDLWAKVVANFQLQQYINEPQVQYEINWFVTHQDLLNRILNNATPYLYYVFEQTQKRNMPAEIALLPVIESGYDPFGYSVVGATGLWQMMPATADDFGLTINWWYDGRRNTVASTQAALGYLNDLDKQFGSWTLALAAYNAGQGTVQTAIDYNSRLGEPTDYWHLPLPTETRNYVPKLLAIAAIVADPGKYGIQLPAIADQPAFVPVKVGSQISVAEAAAMADTTPLNIQKLNPDLERYATEPDSTYTLLVPAIDGNVFQQHLAQMYGHEHTSWVYHQVRGHETIQDVAHDYHTTVATLRTINGLGPDDQLMPKQGLLVPLNLHKVFQAADSDQQAGNSNATDNDDNAQLQNYSAPVGLEAQSTPGVPAQPIVPIKKGDSLKSIVNKLYQNQNQ